MEKKENRELKIPHEVEGNLVNGDAKQAAIVPMLADVGPESFQIGAGVNRIGDDERAPLGPEKLNLRRDMESGEMLLGAQKAAWRSAILN